MRPASLRRFLPVILVVSDAVLIYAAFALAYFVRYTLQIGPDIQAQVTFQEYQPIAFLILIIMIPVLLLKSAYRIRMGTDTIDELGTIFSSATIAIAAMVVVTEMTHRYLYSRGVIVYLWIFVIVLVAFGRALYHGVLGFCHRHGWGGRRVLVVGATDSAKMVMQSMVARPDLGYHLAGFVYHRGASQLADFGRFRALGTVTDVPHLIAGDGIDEVIIALPASAHEEVWPILSLCEQYAVGLKLIPDLFEMSLSRVQVDDIGGIPLLDVQEQPLRRLARVTKRLIDIVLAAVMLVLTLPLIVVLSVLIRLESRGTSLLMQDRIGVGGRRFKCFKLRTMWQDAAEQRAALQGFNNSTGPVFKMRDDPRRTRVGRRIRTWSLDELPQFVNVLKGDMSIVGPRPHLPAEVADYEPRHMRRLEVKPGMTGIWQVSGRSDLPFDEMVVMDIYYVDNWSLALDVRILLQTVRAVLARHGAY